MAEDYTGEPLPGQPGPNFEIRPRTFYLHYVTEAELHALRRGADSPSMALLGIMIGVFVQGVASLASGQFSSVLHATFVAVTVASLVLSVYFGWRVVIDRRTLMAHIDRIEQPRRMPE